MLNFYLIFNWFFIGIFAAFFSLLIEILLSGTIFSYDISKLVLFSFFVNAHFILSVFIEEFFKTIFSLFFVKLKPQSTTLYGVLGGLGFATIESILLYYKNNSFFFSPFYWGMIFLHISTFCLIIYFLKKENASPAIKIFLALTSGFLVHLSYNLFVFYL